MSNPDEIQRIAAAMNALRPDWRTSSLVTFLGKHHAGRSYRDLAVAALVVATDPKTKTPQLLNEHGPWWVAAQTVHAGGPTDPLRAPRCPKTGHGSYLVGNCGACRSEELEATDVAVHQAPRTPAVPPERVRQILADFVGTAGHGRST